MYSLQAQEKDFIENKKNTILELLKQSSNVKGEQSLNLIKQSLNLAKNNNFDSLFVVANTALFWHSYSNNDTINRKISLDGFLEEYRDKKNIFAHAKYNYLKGYLYEMNNKIDSAYFCYEKSLKEFLVLKYYINVGEIYNYLTFAQYKAGDRIGFEQNAIKAQNFFKKNKDFHGLSILYINQGLSSGDYNLKKSDEYFEKSLQYADSIIDNYFKEHALILSKLNQSYVYLNKNFSKSYSLANESISYYEKTEHKKDFLSYYIIALYNLGQCEIEIISKEKGYYSLQKALKLAKDSNFNDIEAYVLNGLAHYYKKENKIEKAIEFGEIALLGARNHSDSEYRLNSLK